MKTLFNEVNSMVKTVSRFCLSILIVGGCVSSKVIGQSSSAEPKPIKAVEEIIEVFDRFPLVALGEIHWCLNEHEFIAALIKHPAFANKVNDIVVEFGNAKYQPIMDRYIAGETVAHTELQRVWRNTTATSMVWDAPIYRQFFAVVRGVNKGLPQRKQLRVLLGDPPVDWDAAKTREELLPLMPRDEHFVDVVEREVINKKRKALLISGTAHLRRCCLAGPLGVTARVEKSHPGAVFVVMPHQGFQEGNEELEARLVSWPKPGLALVTNTWLGNLSPDLIFPAMIMRTSPDRPWVPAPSPFKGMIIQDVTDAYLYLGPKASLRYDSIPPEVQRDEAYQRELELRQKLSGMSPAPRRP
jgi:hypothetical protein